MGRPLNKKYFGNRNIGVAATTTDDKIGGEGVANVSFAGGNIGAYLARIPSVTFKNPSEPTGVTALGTVTHVQAVTAEVWDEGQGYKVGDTFSIAGTGTLATFRVTSLRVHSFAVTNPTDVGNTNYDVGNAIALDATNSNGGNSSNWNQPFVISNITVGTGGNAHKLSGGSIHASGRWTGTGTPPASFTLTQDNTRGDLPAGVDHNGFLNYGVGSGDTNAEGAIISVVWGVGDIELLTAGDYTAVNAVHESATRVSGATPTAAAQFDVFYGVKTISVTQKGSGYINVADALPTFSTVTGNEVRATGNAVLTTDSGTSTGAQGNAANQENAILAHAYIDGVRRLVDIIKQEASNRYKVDARGYESTPKMAELVAHSATVASWSNNNVEMDITAFDSHTNEYWVTKLTAHKALLTRKISGNGEFATGKQVKWTFSSAVENVSVKIDNA